MSNISSLQSMCVSKLMETQTLVQLKKTLIPSCYQQINMRMMELNDKKNWQQKFDSCIPFIERPNIQHIDLDVDMFFDEVVNNINIVFKDECYEDKWISPIGEWHNNGEEFRENLYESYMTLFHDGH